MSEHIEDKLQQKKLVVIEKLRSRDDSEFIPFWMTWFSGLPRHHSERHESYYNVLANLAQYHSGTCKKSRPPSTRAFLRDSAYVDPITFKNGPVSKTERVSLLKSIQMYEPFVPNLSHRKKKIMEALSKLNEYLVTSLTFKNIIVDAGMSPEDAAVEADKLKPKTAKPGKSKLPPDVARWKSSDDNCESEYTNCTFLLR